MIPLRTRHKNEEVEVKKGRQERFGGKDAWETTEHWKERPKKKKRQLQLIVALLTKDD